jgi:hypothetical protein
MAANSTQAGERERILDVIRLLKLALDECYRFLEALSDADHVARQDNDPPIAS